MAKPLPVDADGNPITESPEELNPGDPNVHDSTTTTKPWIPAATPAAPQAAPAPTPAASAPDLNDLGYITSQLQGVYKGLGVTPTGPGSGASDIGYFAQKVKDTGGWTPDNAKYWQERIPNELKGLVPPEGGGGNYGGATKSTPDESGQIPGSGSGGNSGPPGAPNNSPMNDLIQQMLASQKSRDSLSAQQYSDQQAFRKNILDTVNGIISKNSGTASADDPVIASQVNAFKGQGEQALRQAREAEAARARAEGSSTGALDSSVAGGYDSLGRNTGAYSAGLVGSENTARRNALLSASQLGAGVVSGDQNTALQDKIATLNSALSASQTQGNQAVDWATLLQKPMLANIAAGPGYANADVNRLGVNNQNQQYYDKFTYDQAQNDQMSNLLAQLLLKGA